MVKQFIKNRIGKSVCVLVEENKAPRGLVFIMHGLTGYKEQPHIQVMANAFKEQNYTVIRFDTTNAWGESEGNQEEATVTQYLNDLEDVIQWAKNQRWYKEPFVLAGHSLGSFCILLYAEKFPEKVKAIAPTSTVVSGKLNVDKYPKEIIEDWKRSGIREWNSYSGKLKRLKWNYVEDGLKYDVLPKISKIIMPVLLVVGSNDESTSVDDQELLYSKLKSKKELHIIEGSEHTFREKEHLKKLEEIFDKWIKIIK